MEKEEKKNERNNSKEKKISGCNQWHDMMPDSRGKWLCRTFWCFYHLLSLIES